jgi:oligopeptide transport system permease protein
MFSKRSMSEQDLMNTFTSPFTNGFIFGTDELGRDLWVRVWYGARVSLTIGFAAAFVDFIIGVIVGGIAGYYGGKVDNIIMRICDVLIGIPYLMIVILLTMVLSPGIVTIVLALSITGWTGMARLVRGQIIQLKEQEFVLAAKVLGANATRIILKHLLPNTLGIIIVRMTLNIPSAIFSEAFLSFIGLGVRLPIASWGALASDGVAAFQRYPHALFIPAAFICLTMLALNILGDAFRDALDPKLRK